MVLIVGSFKNKHDNGGINDVAITTIYSAIHQIGNKKHRENSTTRTDMYFRNFKSVSVKQWEYLLTSRKRVHGEAKTNVILKT